MSEATPLISKSPSWVRRVVQAVITCEIGELTVEAVDRSLQRQDAVLRVLELVLVEQRRVEGGDAERARDTSVQADGLARDYWESGTCWSRFRRLD